MKSEDAAAVNPVEKARLRHLALGLPLIDLSDGNPVTQKLSLEWEFLADSFSGYLRDRNGSADARGVQVAREAVVAYYRERSPAFSLTAENIFIVSSTSEAYGLLMTLLCEPGDTILEPQVSYALFEVISSTHFLTRRSYANPPPGISNLSGSALSDLLLNASAIFAISPHNPCGDVILQAEPEISSSGLPLIVDEVFTEFSLSGEPFPPAGIFYPDNPVFLLNGISKMCGLPDFKISWIALNNCALERYGKRLEFLNDIYLSASFPIQQLLPEILDRRHTYRALVIERINRNYQTFSDIFRRCPQVWHQAPVGGTTIFPRIETPLDQELFLLALLDRGVSVHPGYYHNWEDDFRLAISLQLEPAQFEVGINILRQHITDCQVAS